MTPGDSFFWHDASFVRGAAGTFPRSYQSQVDFAFKFNTRNTVLFVGLQKNPTVGSAIDSLVLFVHESCVAASQFLSHSFCAVL